jgi:hypothetical protein
MRGKRAGVIVFISLTLAGGSACAMNGANTGGPRCQVVGGEKLPDGSGGPDALCAAIEKAASAHAPGLAYKVEVRVLSGSRLSGTVTTAAGERLPDQQFAIADRTLTRISFDQFAEAIAAQLGAAMRQ